jgi:phytoene desaturase
MPQKTPALYSLMNYAGLKLGTWYPEGGFGKVVDAMKQVAEENGAKFHFNTEVEEISIEGNEVNAIAINGEEVSCDATIATADYHHVENNLLPPSLTAITAKSIGKIKPSLPPVLFFIWEFQKKSML